MAKKKNKKEKIWYNPKIKAWVVGPMRKNIVWTRPMGRKK